MITGEIMNIENLEFIGMPERVVEAAAETTVPPQTGAENAMRVNEAGSDWVGPMVVAGLGVAAIVALKTYRHPWSHFLKDRQS
jgi:hypothetical protein